MSHDRRLLVATGSDRLDAAVASALGRRSGRGLRTCADLADLLAAAGAGLGDVAVVGARLPLLDRTALLRLAAGGVVVVGVHAADDPEGAARLGRLGVLWTRPVDAGGDAPTGAGLARCIAEAVAATDTGAATEFSRRAGQGRGTTPGRRGPGATDATRSPAGTHGLGAPVTSPVGSSPTDRIADPGRAVTAPVPVASAWRELGPDDLDRLWDDAELTAEADPAPGDGFTAADVDTFTAADLDTPEDVGRPAPEPEVVAVWGPAGAPGRTTVAVTLAGLAAARGLRVVLADLDPYGGTVAAHLGLPDEAPGVVRALRAADQGDLDAAGLDEHGTWAGGVLVLSGVTGGERWPELRPAGIAGLLGAAREAADLVVLDTGFCLEDDEELSYDTAAPRRNAATLTALAEADRIVVVGQPGPVGLPRLVGALADLDALAVAATRTVVVNRVRAAMLGPGGEPGLLAALRRLAGVGEPLLLPDDPAALDAALATGTSPASASPPSAFARAARALLP